MSEEIILVVNGKRHTVQAAADTPLLYVLRNELGLTGPQYGCGRRCYGPRLRGSWCRDAALLRPSAQQRCAPTEII